MTHDDPPLITKAYELYAEIQRRGLHIRRDHGRDNALLADLGTRLGCPDDRLMAYLRASDLDAEPFLLAFLEVAEPFAAMFQQIWEYLAEHAAPRASERLRVRFGFPDDAPVEIDLDVFRERVRTTTTALARVRSRMWTLDTMHGLFDLCRTADVPGGWDDSWGSYHPGEPYELPPLGPLTDEFEEILSDIHALFRWIIDESVRAERTHSPAGDRGKSLPEVGDRDPETRDPAREEIRRAAYLLTDLMPAWVQVFARYDRIPPESRERAARHFRDRIAPQLPTSERSIQTRIDQLLDILAMPFWRHRWHTYEVWASVLCLRWLADFEPVPRVEEGRLPIDGYQTGVLADLHAENHPSACVIAQLETPCSLRGRTAIRPDLNVCFDDGLGAASRAVVVEFKQRQALTASHAQEVGTAYREGSPDAGGVLLLNYDEVFLDLDLPDDVALVQGVRPGNPTAIKLAERRFRAFLDAARLLPDREERMVLLDVSGSMSGQYEGDDVVAQLRRALTLPNTRVLRFDTNLVAGGDLSESEVATLRTAGGTDLDTSLAQAVDRFGLPDALLVVTDGGYGQRSGLLDQVGRTRECMPADLGDALDWLMSREPWDDVSG